MSFDITDISSTIIPRSDQTNADQLLTGPMDITVVKVSEGSVDQPLNIHYENDGGRPFRPCKTCRRILALAWGKDARQWVGRSMRLYADPAVKFGGQDVGGVRISHMTDIPKDINVQLTATKGKKAPHTIKLMRAPDSGIEQTVRILGECATIEDLKATFGTAYKAAGKDTGARGRLKVAYDLRVTALQIAAFIDRIDNAADRDAASVVLQEALAQLGEEHHAEIQQAFTAAWES